MWDLIVSVPDHCLSFYIENAEIWEGSRYPLLLPKYHRYTDLVIQY